MPPKNKETSAATELAAGNSSAATEHTAELQLAEIVNQEAALSTEIELKVIRNDHSDNDGTQHDPRGDTPHQQSTGDEQHSAEVVSVYVARYKRSGAQFTEALRNHPRLKQCMNNMRDALLDEGQHDIAQLSRQTWIFLEPEHVQPTLAKITREGITLAGKRLHLCDLRAWHVIAGPGYSDVVDQIIEGLAGKLQVKARDRITLQIQVEQHAHSSSKHHKFIGDAYVLHNLAHDEHAQADTTNSSESNEELMTPATIKKLTKWRTITKALLRRDEDNRPKILDPLQQLREALGVDPMWVLQRWAALVRLMLDIRVRVRRPQRRIQSNREWYRNQLVKNSTKSVQRLQVELRKRGEVRIQERSQDDTERSANEETSSAHSRGEH